MGCTVTLRTPDAARVLSLEKGQPRLYDSDPLRVIEEVDPLLKGWQFTSIPQRIDNEYEVSVSQPGTLIAFGGLRTGNTKEDVFGKEAPQWQTDDQAIKGTMIKMCYRREVKAGEIIKMKAFELQLAASKIVIEKSAPSVADIPPVTPLTVSPAPVLLPTAPMPSTSPPTPSTPTLEPKPAMGAGDWQPLFPSNTLAGWTGDVAGYSLANGILTSTDKGGDLISPKEYGGFHLKFDLRLTVGANNGIGVWCADNKGPYNFVGHTGFEIQLIDDNLPTYTKGDPWHLHGALSYFLTPKAKPMGLPGSWNSHELRIEGTHITLLINDKIVLDEELPRGYPVSGGSRRHRLDFSRQRGHLVFCGMKGPVEFRNVRIKELGAATAISPMQSAVTSTTSIASATTWIDTKGRSLQANFVRLEGSNVLLDIASKVTPVPISTLSAASQQIARDLYQPPAQTLPYDWLVGRWLETLEGENKTSFADYLPDGSVIFGYADAELMGRWILSGTTLVQQWPNNVRDDFTITASPDGNSADVTGTTNGKTVRIHMRKIANVAARQLPTPDELEGKKFEFFWKNSADPSRSKVVTDRILAQGGKVEGVDPEYLHWQMRGGKVIIFGKNGKECIHYDTFYKVGDSWVMQGHFFLIKGITHVMRQKTLLEPPAIPPGNPSSNGWIPLFPDDALSGWTGDTSAYRYSNDILTGTGKGDLISPQEYGNFHLKFDLRISAEANSGIGIWRDAATGATAGAPRGVEVQIQDDTAPKYRAQDFWQRHGGIYYFKEPLTLAMNAVGSWNTHEILVEGTQIKVTVNGKLVQDADVTKLRPVTARAPLLDISRKRGHLIILGRNGVVEFRNMQIKELP